MNHQLLSVLNRAPSPAGDYLWLYPKGMMRLTAYHISGLGCAILHAWNTVVLSLTAINAR